VEWIPAQHSVDRAECVSLTILEGITWSASNRVDRVRDSNRCAIRGVGLRKSGSGGGTEREDGQFAVPANVLDVKRTPDGDREGTRAHVEVDLVGRALAQRLVRSVRVEPRRVQTEVPLDNAERSRVFVRGRAT
jgi:hypothetical protein